MSNAKLGRMMDRTTLSELAQAYTHLFEHYGDHCGFR